ncbi:hypothetical protein QZH41_004284 [Actinostola sp. cb2023]|nr:hypothetical protein QZH41_004284 [Actinostola sp. cb2023]
MDTFDLSAYACIRPRTVGTKMSAITMKVLLAMSLIPGVIAFHRVYKSGDISIGSLISLHKEKTGNDCTRFYLPGLNRVEAIIYTVNKINNNSEVLRNITLGYDIRDYCNDRASAMKETYDFTTSNSFAFDSITDFSSSAKFVCRQCLGELRNRSDSVVAVIGPYGSRNSLQVAGLLQVVGMAGISPSATSEELSWPFYNKFFRTVSPDNYQAKAMADLIDHFNWNYVAAVAVEHSYGLYGIRALERESTERKTFCIGFTEYVSPTGYQKQLQKIVSRLKADTNVKVVVLWIADRIAIDLMTEAKRQEVHYRIWIMSDSLATKTPESLGSDFVYLGTYLGIQPKQYRDVEYEKHLLTMTPKKSLSSGNTFWEKLWMAEFGCTATPNNATDQSKTCPENLTITETIFNKLYDDFIPYQVDAVYAVAHVIDNIHHCKNGSGLLQGGACPPTTPTINPQHALLYLRNVSFEGITGRIQFDQNGDPLGSTYDIISFQKEDSIGSRYTKVRVGTWDKNQSPRLAISNNSIAWNTSFNGIPKSVCKDLCPPAVQTTKLPAFPNFQFPFYGDMNAMYAQTMFPLTVFQSPFNTPITFPMGMIPINQTRPDAAYELAANVLFSMMDWAKKLTTFNHLLENDQITLLKMAWSDLFLLEAARSPLHMYVQQMYSTINAQLSMDVILKRMEYARLFQEQQERIRNLGMDMTEHFHLKCIVLFRAEGSLINQPRQVEVLQDTSQSSLEQYIRAQYSNQPTRFEKKQNS